MNCSICSSVIGSPTSPSPLWTDKRYLAMVDPSSVRAGRSRPSSCYERPTPNPTRAHGIFPQLGDEEETRYATDEFGSSALFQL